MDLQTKPTAAYERVFIIEPNIYPDTEERLAEMKELVRSADGEVCGYVVPKLREIYPATYIGTGKLLEILEEIKKTDADCVVFDGELSPSQQSNMADFLENRKLIDRTGLILDIFALHADSNEGKLQVELAQLKYIYPRLKGNNSQLSRLGGGIGTRGPGETKLETDRRYIQTRIHSLERELAEMQQRRNLQFERRKKNEMRTVALVGYTNSGKSTLINRLTDSTVLAENKLFATLDPTVRKMALPDGEILVTDTVGFLRDIPHDLIRAFRSTLEVACHADLVLCVVDGSSDEWKKHYEVTESTLRDLKCEAPLITVINKCDKIENPQYFPKDSILISALTGMGIERLIESVNQFFLDRYKTVTLFYPFAKIGEYHKAAADITVLEENYTEEGVLVNARIPKIQKDRFRPFLYKEKRK